MHHVAIHCDLTGDIIALADLPIVVEIGAAVVPGAERNPLYDEIPPVVRAMLFDENGRSRSRRFHFSAEAFTRIFTADPEQLGPALMSRESPHQELQRLREENVRLRAGASTVSQLSS